MKLRLAISKVVLVTAAALVVACTGAIAPGSEPGAQGDDAPLTGGASSGGRQGPFGTGGGGSGGTRPAAPLVRNPALDLTCSDPSNPSPGPSPLARLTNLEYANTLRDLFAGVSVPKVDLPSDATTKGFNNDAVGQTPSTLLIENLETAAGNIAPAVIDKVVTCQPATATDEGACLDQLLTTFGKRAFRRPLTTAEITRFKAAFATMRQTDDFKTSARLLVQGMLQSPQFLYRLELGAAAGTSGIKLSGYEMASRLSYLFWDTMPDAELFRAAEAGELNETAGLQKQATRLLADPRGKSAVGEFLAQWLEFARLDANIAKKDKTLFPKFNDATIAGLRDGNRRYLDYVFWEKGGNLGTLLTDNTAFVNDATASLYGVSAPDSPTSLKPVAVDASKRAGFLTQAGVLAGFAHETLQAPILRGIFVLDRLLCSPPPPPPPGVSTAVPDGGKAGLTTLRQRIEMFHEQGTCKSCHQVIDPIGFGLETFDAIGQYRTTENGLNVDTSGTITQTYDANGAFNGAVELAQRLAKSEQVAECVATQWFRYALGRTLSREDGCVIKQLTDGMVASKGDMQALLGALVSTSSFRNRAPFTR